MDLVTPCLTMALRTGRQLELVMKSQLPGSLSGVRQVWPVTEPRDPNLNRVWRAGAGSSCLRMSTRDIRPLFPPPCPGLERPEKDTELSVEPGLLEVSGLAGSVVTEFPLNLIWAPAEGNMRAADSRRTLSLHMVTTSPTVSSPAQPRAVRDHKQEISRPVRNIVARYFPATQAVPASGRTAWNHS